MCGAEEGGEQGREGAWSPVAAVWTVAFPWEPLPTPQDVL